MRYVKSSFALILMICLVLSVKVPAFAADPPKDYCVIRVFGGAQRPGLITSIQRERGSTCNLGTELAAYLGSDVTCTKYYTKSTIRESGEEEELTSLTINVEKDRDYVLTYGVKNNQVTYYVRYVDTDGEEGMANTSNLIYDTIDLYNKKHDYFTIILNKFNDNYS